MRFWPVYGAAGSPSLPTAAYQIPTTPTSCHHTSDDYVTNPTHSETYDSGGEPQRPGQTSLVVCASSSDANPRCT
jgi:hypothetical protein